MSAIYDLVIRHGTVLDGSGGPGISADVAVLDGRIAKVGRVAESGKEEIDAKGLFVTPGFVDIHTHYDGHVTWGKHILPSSAHGVTTVVMGNCGVGFAPCKDKDRDKLVSLMAGVEDIPEIVMTEGLPWDWNTFPEYLNSVANRPHDVDVAALLPHCPLRVFVMGERGVQRQPATEEDIRQMSKLAAEAVRAGAYGFATTRTMFHRDSTGAEVASRGAREDELFAIASAMRDAGGGIVEATFDVGALDEEFDLLHRLAKKTGCPVRFSLIQLATHPKNWQRALDLIRNARKDGVDILAQVMSRPVGVMYGLSVSYNPFSLYPTYAALAHLPLAERVKEMRKPEVRAAILNDPDRLPELYPALKFLTYFDDMYPLGDPPNYEPSPEDSIARAASRRGIRPEELVYDYMLEDDGRALLLSAFINFVDKDFRAIEAMVQHEGTLLGLGDAGAHLGMVCDGSYPTYMLTHWVRDRPAGVRLGLEKVIQEMTSRSAQSMGMHDRGLVAEGYKADLNVIDLDRLRLHPPRAVHDLPGGGLRLDQTADGYVATMLSGVVTQRNGKPTGALPGVLMRNSAGTGG